MSLVKGRRDGDKNENTRDGMEREGKGWDGMGRERKGWDGDKSEATRNGMGWEGKRWVPFYSFFATRSELITIKIC